MIIETTDHQPRGDFTMNLKFNQADRAELHSQGFRFIVTVELGSDRATPIFDLTADSASDAIVLAKTWIAKHDAISAAVHRIFHDGRTGLVNIYDYRDVEEVA